MSDRTSLKELQIKTGIVKRYIQEYKCYEKEANKLQDKVQQLKQESADNYDIKKAMEILNETKMMLPLTQSCLKKAVSDLKSLIDTHESFFKENSIDLIPSHEFIEVAETICA